MQLDDLGPLVGPAAPGTARDAAMLVSGAPLVIRLTDEPDPGLVGAAAATLRTMPTVTVLVGEPALIPHAVSVAADVCLAPSSHPLITEPAQPWVHDEVTTIVDAVAAHPEAALALVALLRTSEGLPTWRAVAAEAATYAALLGGADFASWLAHRGRPRTRPDSGARVALRREDGTLVVELDRAEVHNALDRAMRDQLVDAFELAVIDESITSVELSGRGPSFCAGGDLAEFGAVDDGSVALAIRLTRHPGLAVAAVARRTTVHLHGACMGAGIEVPAFAHEVVADPSTRIALPELAMGLVPGAGGTVSIPRRIGRARTAWLALTGAELDAATALAWGLVDALEDRVES